MSAAAFARFYQKSFDSNPNTTLAITGGTLNGFGDFVAQQAQRFLHDGTHEDRPRYDYARTLRFCTYGFFLSPLLGRWNGFLERKFPLRAQPGGAVSIPALSKRVGADQLFMAPIGLVAFIGAMGVMEGRDANHIQEKFADMYTPALLANWKVWPLAQLINFRFMPLPYRVPFQSTCGVFWTLYLSILNSREDKKQDLSDDLRRTTKQQ